MVGAGDYRVVRAGGDCVELGEVENDESTTAYRIDTRIEGLAK
jgi:hypothetical protein